MAAVIDPCRHPAQGIPWRMAPLAGTVLRVRLCPACGRTRPARLEVLGVPLFDQLAARAIEQVLRCG
jgi:hypothetical protein